MKNSSRFFRNTSCAYFPCHPNADPETFNCLFCYCPLYFLPECIGTPRWSANGIKDCTLCRAPHQPDNDDRIIQKLYPDMHNKSFIPSIFNFLQFYQNSNFFFCPFCFQ